MYYYLSHSILFTHPFRPKHDCISARTSERNRIKNKCGKKRETEQQQQQQKNGSNFVVALDEQKYNKTKSRKNRNGSNEINKFLCGAVSLALTLNLYTYACNPANGYTACNGRTLIQINMFQLNVNFCAAHVSTKYTQTCTKYGRGRFRLFRFSAVVERTCQ